MPTPASTVLRRLAYKRVAERIAADLEYQLKQGWVPNNVFLCHELAAEAGHYPDYYSPKYWRGYEDCNSWDKACEDALAALQTDWPEFALFKPKHRKVGESWFGDDFHRSVANTNRRLLVLAFCIAIAERP